MTNHELVSASIEWFAPLGWFVPWVCSVLLKTVVGFASKANLLNVKFEVPVRPKRQHIQFPRNRRLAVYCFC